MPIRRTASTFTPSTLLVLVVAFALVSAPVSATGCNGGGCWFAQVTFIQVGTDGKLWFTVDNSAALANLNPPGGCVMKNVNTGQAEPALYIRTDDPDRDEKYTVLLLAFATGSLLRFNAVRDTANGWCALGYVSVS